MSIEARLAELGITLPKAAAPAANYVPTVLHGNTLYISGQIPFRADGTLVLGRLGEDMDVPAGQAAARLCGIGILAQAEAALGSLDRIERVLKLGAFVSSTANFYDQPKVANGCSDLMVEVLGDAGRHARSAVGVPALPLGVAVEVDAVIAVKA
ncbi:RidA family protein [Sphingosinicella microcystinivorans]|uniref:RidA family protein n=1 Tax=Sphingosinicella microcystinivorans TaxID=335406 RepID=UPI001C6CD7DE|nr:RidA family protein [Sphingosinicella microcystinivorans]MBW7947070.1 RidA family protein [Sphingomonadaceae bacterium]WBX83888.1 RidA family protein [Sphingosinicella microcystinivorans]